MNRRYSISLFSLFVLFTLCFLPETKGQDHHVLDSLHQVVRSQVHDTIRIDAYLTLAGEYAGSNPKEAIHYASLARDLAQASGSGRQLIITLGWLAYLHEQIGDLPKALALNQEALLLAQRSGNKKRQAILLNNIAAIYKDRGDLENALRLNMESLSLRMELKDTVGIATTYNNLGLIYQGQGRIEVALDHFFKALKWFEGKKDTEGMATTLQNIGAVYKEQKEYEAALVNTRRSLSISLDSKDNYSAGYALNSLGGIHEDNNRLDSALYYYRRALQLRSAIGDQQGEAYTLKNIGHVHEKLHHEDEAIASYQRSLFLFDTLEDKWGQTKVTQEYGTLLLKQGKNAEAEQYLERSIQLARELGYPADISSAALPLQQLYRRRGEYLPALVMYDEYLVMHDSILNDNNRQAAIRSQYRYAYEKKEAVFKSEQEKQNALASAELQYQKLLRNSFMLGLLLVMGFAVIVLLQRNRIGREKKISDTEKLRSEELLLNILPEEVAEELKATGTAKAKAFTMVTVMLTDFKDFTTISEKVSAELLVAEIHHCFSAFDHIIHKYKIEKIKTIGDAYLCASGLPVSNYSHAVDMIRAAFEIRDFMHQRKLAKEALGEAPFEIRIGIHTGPVVAGIVGIKKYAYDIWGDTVNLAARMEQNSEAGKINISEHTYELVKDKFNFTFRGKIEAKNKGMVNMYFVEA